MEDFGVLLEKLELGCTCRDRSCLSCESANALRSLLDENMSLVAQNSSLSAKAERSYVPFYEGSAG